MIKQVKLCGYDLEYNDGEKSGTCTLKAPNGTLVWEYSLAQGDIHKPTNDTNVLRAIKTDGTEKDFHKENGKDIIITVKRALDWIHTKQAPEPPKQHLGQEKPTETSKEATNQEKTEKTNEESGGKETEITAIITEKKRPPHLFKPGQSGNPAGRPKGTGTKLLTKMLREELDREYGVIKKPDGTEVTITYAQQIIRKMLERAANGDARHTENIFDRTDGKVKNEVEFTRPEHREITPEEKEELDKLLYADNDGTTN